MRLIAVVVVVLAAAVFAYYGRDIDAALARIATGAHVVDTPCGPIQYAEAGEGAPLLVIHGAGGGFDQGLELAAPLARRGFRLVAPSRFGYLGTPLPPDASVPAQARAHACLLDALGIRGAAVLGASAGAPSALQLAILFPERTSKLVLLVPATYAPRPGGAASLEMPGGLQFLFDTTLRSDFLFWAMIHALPGVAMRTIFATPSEAFAQAPREEQARVEALMTHTLPVSARRPGMLNDAGVVTHLGRYELEKIAAPTLVVTARDDFFGTWETGRYTASQIPGARFVGYDTGGHLLAGREAQAMDEIAAFLR